MKKENWIFLTQLCGLAEPWIRAMSYLLKSPASQDCDLAKTAQEVWDMAKSDPWDEDGTVNGWNLFLCWTIRQLENAGRADLSLVFEKGIASYHRTEWAHVFEEIDKIEQEIRDLDM